MKKDSTVIDFGGIVIEDVRTINDSNGKFKEIIEHKTHNGLGMPGKFRDVITFYFILMFALILLAGFLAWFYMRSRSEIARLMIQNNMQPGELFKSGNEDNGKVSPYLRYGIILIAIGLAFLVNFILERIGISKLKVPVVLIFLGASLLFINSIRKK